jgi:hypothetical protein
LPEGVTLTDPVRPRRTTHAASEAHRTDRPDRVLARIRHLLTPEQLAAITAVRTLDPDAIGALDDETLRMVLRNLADPALTREPTSEASEAARRFLEEIM